MVASRFAFHSSNTWLGVKSPFDKLPGIQLWKSQQSHVSAVGTLVRSSEHLDRKPIGSKHFSSSSQEESTSSRRPA